MTDHSTAPTKQPLFTIWDLVSAFGIGCVGFAMSVIHQEALWVCFLSGGILFAIMLGMYPLVHALRRRHAARR
jgi:hypothetical protein